MDSIPMIRLTMPTWNSFNALVVGRSGLRVGGASTVGNPKVFLDSLAVLDIYVDLH